MANIKVSEMPLATSVAPEDLIMLIQGGGNKKVTTDTLLGDSVIVSLTEPTEYNRKKVWFRWSNNLLNYNDLTNLAINFGVKVDGENVYSTATSDSRDWNYNNSNWFITLPAGTYNISLLYSKQATNVNAGIGVYLKEKSIFFTNTANVSNFNRTFTLDEESKVGIMTKIYDGIFKIQIEQGSKATTFQPYVEPQIYIKNSNDVYEEFIKKEDIAKVNIVSAKTGYTLISQDIFKQGKHYWGYVVIKKDSGVFDANDYNVADINIKSSSNAINNACYLTDDVWTSKCVGYLYVSQYNSKTGVYPFVIVKDTNNSNSNYAKFFIDMIED